MLFALASISMLFIGLTSAYAVRQGLDPGWRGIRLPALLLVNTVILLASSFTLEKGRRAGNANALIRWLGPTVLLGSLFLIGQLAAWRQLSDRGVYLGTNPHGAFFYVLTCLHGLHLLGGLLALSYLSLRVRLDHGSLVAADTGRQQAIMAVERRTRMVDVTAMYWHFMDGLWVYLLLLLFVWR
jgi:cytochrome c oxidase subunit 3